MPRRFALVFMIVGCLCCHVTSSYSQASKELEKRTKNLQNTVKKTWEQVDQINRESDNSKARYQQGRKAGGLDKQKKGYDVTKHGIAPADRSYKKTEKPKKVEPKPKKK